MNRISGSISSLNESFDMKKCHCLQQDLNPGPCGCKSNIIPTQLQQLDTPCHIQKWFIYESLPQISFLVMKVVSCGLAQRILVIHGGLTHEYPKYPLTQSVSRENLSGESPEGKSQGAKPRVIFPKEYCHHPSEGIMGHYEEEGIGIKGFTSDRGSVLRESPQTPEE